MICRPKHPRNSTRFVGGYCGGGGSLYVPVIPDKHTGHGEDQSCRQCLWIKATLSALTASVQFGVSQAQQGCPPDHVCKDPVATRTPGAPERLQQEGDLPLDPLLVATLPHAEVPEHRQGESPGVLPAWSIVESNPWGRGDSRALTARPGAEGQGEWLQVGGTQVVN